MPDCAGPLWPCGLTGAAACLSGIRDVCVVIHGSAGCYFYPATMLHAPLYCTSLNDQDIIHGTEEALFRTIDSIEKKYSRIFILCTCIPSITGEDIRAALKGRYGDREGTIVLDAPGFAGEYEAGYRTAISCVDLPGTGGRQSVNIDGLSLMDPFWRGNLREIERMLPLAGAGCGATLCAGDTRLDTGVSPFTVHANPDLVSGRGRSLGSMLGIPAMKETIPLLEDRFGEGGGVLSCKDLPDAEERIIASCDKFMRRFDPPGVVLSGQSASMQELAGMLSVYLGADILGIASRNSPVKGKFPVEQVRDYGTLQEMIGRLEPDLIVGSSFEQTAYPAAAFVGATPPLRGTVRLHARPLAGIEGALAFMESVLNACIDHRKLS